MLIDKYSLIPFLDIHSFYYTFRCMISTYIVKAMHLEKPKRLIILNGGSI